jgi:putative endonuclease
VYFETSGSVRTAITREKQVKAWTRAKRVALIEASNPTWDDLAAEWLPEDLKADPSLRSG